MNKTITEADILDEMVTPNGADFSPEGARALLALQFTPTATSRINELAEKNQCDALSPAEREEMEKFMRVGNFLSIIKAKARLSLARQTSKP